MSDYFHCQTWKQAYLYTKQILSAAEIETAAIDARLLLEHVSGLTRESFLLKSHESPSITALQELHTIVKERLNRKPIAYIVGKKGFWRHEFFVNEHVLIPRADSEALIEFVCNYYHSLNTVPKTILDLGVGSGCLLLSLLDEFQQAQGVGIDISFEALACAKKNAETIGGVSRSLFIQADWLSALRKEPRFDLIISNPPYIALVDKPTLMPDVANFEPKKALFSGLTGLEVYDYLSRYLTPYKHKDLLLVLEIGYGQEQEVITLFLEHNWIHLATKHDIQGIPRIVAFKGDVL